MTSIGRVAVALVACALSFAAPAAAATGEPLVLYRSSGHSRGGTVDLFVRGARPNEKLLLIGLGASAAEDPTALAMKPLDDKVADGAGCACFHVDVDVLPQMTQGRPFFVRAVPVRLGPTTLWSNPVLLQDLPSLYLLVDGAATSSRALRFDPFNSRLDLLVGGLDLSARFAVAGPTASPVVERNVPDHRLVRLDSSGQPLDSFELGNEQLLDLVATADASLLVALTQEILPEGRALIRLRLIDAADLSSAGSLDLLRNPTRLLNAWLVSGADPHRLFIWQRDAAVREVLLASALEPGLTLLPLSALGGEEIVDVRVDGSWLVAVSRVAPGARGGRQSSRLFALDLHERRSPVDVVLDVNALHFEIFHHAVYVVSDGRLDKVPLDDSATAHTLLVPGATEIAAGRERLYLLSRDEAGQSASVATIDPSDLTLTPLPLRQLSHLSQQLGVLPAGGREWIFLFDGQARGGFLEQFLVALEVDPPTGLALESDPVVEPVGGAVRRFFVR